MQTIFFLLLKKKKKNSLSNSHNQICTIELRRDIFTTAVSFGICDYITLSHTEQNIDIYIQNNLSSRFWSYC